MHTVSADPGKLWSWGDPSQLGKGQQARIPHIPGWGPPGGMAATGKAGAKNSTAAGEQVSSALTIPSKPHGCFTHNPQFKFQPPPLQRLRGPWRPGCCPQSHRALKERPQGCWQNRSPTRPSARMRSSPPGRCGSWGRPIRAGLGGGAGSLGGLVGRAWKSSGVGVRGGCPVAL